MNLRAVLDTLKAGVRDLASSDAWRAVLDLGSRFYRYSFGNLMLISLQRPTATYVAGYQRWKQLGRQVRKGEHGIRILAPCRYKQETDDGEEETILKGFRVVSVFDVSQTDGKELPSVLSLLDGDAPAEAWDRLAAQVEAQGFRIERGPCEGGNGRTEHGRRMVTVRDDVSAAQATKTLAHELAHVLLHGGTELSRERIEVEAESVAYVVCQALGVETDAYSLGYVAGWSGGKAEAITQAGETILRTASAILDNLGIGTEAQAA